MRLFTKARRRTLKSCEGHTIRISDNEYRVKDYTVYKSSRKGWLCECKHFVYKQTPCSHIVYVITRELAPKLMTVEVKHMPNLLDKIVFGKSNNTDRFVPIMSVLTVMSVPMPLLLTRESIRVPPGRLRHG